MIDVEVKIREPRDVEVVFVIHFYYEKLMDDLCAHLGRLRETMDFEVVVTIPKMNEYEPLVSRIVKGLDPFMLLSLENQGFEAPGRLQVLLQGAYQEGYSVAWSERE
jgi:hypothetical protein